ncbi:hypothetical protein HispidOSU_017948, partial [Sigmodon hispidus]
GHSPTVHWFSPPDGEGMLTEHCFRNQIVSQQKPENMLEENGYHCEWNAGMFLHFG